MYDKFIKLLDDPKFAAGIASMLLAAVGWLTRQLSKVPHQYRQKAREKRNQQSVVDGARRDRIMHDLKRTGAKYIHLVRYHNGGSKLKQGVPISLTVDLEKTGSICDKCITKCRFYNGEIKPLMNDWQNIKIQGSWFNVVKRTVLSPNDVNIVKLSQLDAAHQQIWEKYVIDEYHEILVKHKKDCFYTIGLSFCPRFKNHGQTQGILSLAARQMANLL